MGQIKEISPLRPTPPVRPKVKRERQNPTPAQDEQPDAIPVEEDSHDQHIDEFV
jgi:hypothetical protein